MSITMNIHAHVHIYMYVHITHSMHLHRLTYLRAINRIMMIQYKEHRAALRTVRPKTVTLWEGEEGEGEGEEEEEEAGRRERGGRKRKEREEGRGVSESAALPLGAKRSNRRLPCQLPW